MKYLFQIVVSFLSVAKHLRCEVIFDDNFIANLLQSLVVKTEEL